MKCARCSRPIQAAAAWSGGSPFGPTCAQIMELVPVGAPSHQCAPTAAFVERRRAKWVDVGQQEMFEGFDMSRKKCIRKHWNTAAGFDPVMHAIAGARVTNKETLDALQLRVLSALEAMTHGNATVADWRELADLVNITETAADVGVGPEAIPFCESAQASLVASARRYEATGCMGLSGDGIRALRDVAEYHRLQAESISRSEYEEILKKTVNRVRSGSAAVEMI